MATSATAGGGDSSSPRETGAFPMSTLREPYRIEGKKTLGLESRGNWDGQLPDVVIYPAGGGTGLIGMWLAFPELLAADGRQGRRLVSYAVQSSGCAPVVARVGARADRCEPWTDPWTVASGLRVPAPLGGRSCYGRSGTLAQARLR